jgi:hypothetical protein
MMIPATLLCTVFVTLSIVHLYWAFGGQRGWEGAIPTQDGVPVFKPGTLSTVLVAMLLLFGGFVSMWRAGVLDLGPAWIARVGVWLIAAVFAIRAVGDFRYCGFFKRVRGTVFARNDTILYSPLSLTISAVAVWLSLAA